jgi:gamma-glutamyltranspeptidase / glutathione hydrolase
MRDLHFPGRSVAYGSKGAVATSQQLSSSIAMEVLRHGGNAVDAALTASAVQCVIEPHNTGIGGDCFVLYWRADHQKLYGLNGSGWAPEGLTDRLLMDAGMNSIGTENVHAITIPGAVDAWSRLLSDHGTRSFADILEPAIELAENGFFVHERAAADWAEEVSKLRKDAGARAQLLKNDQAPKAGERMRFPELASTLRLLSEEGRDSFYKGSIAKDLVAFLLGKGGTHSLSDFSDFASYYVDPIKASYRGVDVYQIPPSGQGLTALVLLRILDGFSSAGIDPISTDRFHLQIEATQLAYSVRDSFVADPAFADVPVDELLSDAFIESLRSRINLKRASAGLSSKLQNFQRDTIYLTVADQWGNMCSFINSLYYSFGTGMVSPKTGIALQNRGACFRVEPGHPNNVAPRKRPLHTIIPAMAFKDHKPWMSFGVMGGAYQPVGQAHVLQNLIDFEMNIQEAFDAPRGFRRLDSFEGERGIPESVMLELAMRGHPVTRPDMPLGGGQAIVIGADYSYAAGTDPRKDGVALAY